MNKHINSLLAVALVALAVCAGDAAAGVKIKTFAGGSPPPGVSANGRMKWIKLASTDSTRVAIGVWGPSTTEAAAEDTTDWLDTGNIQFAEGGFTGSPMLQFQINHQIGAATDSVGFKLQYASDTSDKTTFSTGALTHIAANAGGSTFIDALAPIANSSSVTAQLAQGARFVRLIILNDKIGTGATRLYSVVPVARVVN